MYCQHEIEAAPMIGDRSSGAAAHAFGIRPVMRQFRVMHFIDSGGIYGAEKVVLNLAQQMQRDPEFCPVVGCIVQKAGESVALADKARSLGIESTEVVINNKWFPFHLLAAARSLKRLRIDLIHSHGYKPSVFGYFISKLMGASILATCHLWFAGANPPLKYRVMTRLEVFLYRFFRRIVCVSPRIRELLLGRGIADHQLVVIDNGIEVGDASSRRDDASRIRARQALSLDNEDFVVLNVGRLSEQKGQSKIIELAGLMKARGEPAVFLIAGEGEEREALEVAIAERQLEGVVRLLGFREDISDLLDAADVFFMPSLDEGLPISLLEAMAGRIPVVVTPVGAIPQLVRHEQEGLLVEVNDVEGMYSALSRVRRAPQSMMHLAENALTRVKRHHSSETMYRSYRRIYEELVSTLATRNCVEGQ